MRSFFEVVRRYFRCIVARIYPVTAHVVSASAQASGITAYLVSASAQASGVTAYLVSATAEAVTESELVSTNFVSSWS